MKSQKKTGYMDLSYRLWIIQWIDIVDAINLGDSLPVPPTAVLRALVLGWTDLLRTEYNVGG